MNPRSMRRGLSGSWLTLLCVAVPVHAAEPSSTPASSPAPVSERAATPDASVPTAPVPSSEPPVSNGPALATPEPSAAAEAGPGAPWSPLPMAPTQVHGSRNSTSSAPATIDPGAERVDDGSLGDSQRMIALEAGVRSLIVLGGGYEPYAERAMLWSFGLGGSTTLAVDGPLSLGLGVAWEAAASQSNVRAAETELLAHRFLLVPEVRYHFGRRWLAFGRLGAGGAYLRATLDDLAAQVERKSDAALLTFDLGFGAKLQLGSTGQARRKAARFWLSLDAGYLWSSAADLEFQSDTAPARTAAIRLGELSLHGPYTRLGALMSF